MIDFYTKIEQGMELKTIDSISWNVTGGFFQPEKCEVMLQDIEGHEWSLVIHDPQNYSEYVNEEEVILNVIFAFHGLLNGEWLGLNCTIEQLVNSLRKKFPYKEVFQVYEGSLFREPIHRF